MTNTGAKILPFQKRSTSQNNKSTLEASLEEMNSLLSNNLESQTQEPLCFSEEELIKGYEKMMDGEIIFSEDYSINSFYKNLKDNKYIENK